MNKRSPYADMLRNGYVPKEEEAKEPKMVKLRMKAPRKSRDKHLAFTCTKEEKRLIRISARYRKMTLSNFLRMCVFNVVNGSVEFRNMKEIIK